MGNWQDELAKVFPDKAVTAKQKRAGPQKSKARAPHQNANSENKYRGKNPAPSLKPPATPRARDRARKQSLGSTEVPAGYNDDLRVYSRALQDVYQSGRHRNVRPTSLSIDDTPEVPELEAIVTGALAVPSEFKKPDDWVPAGAALQASTSGSGRALVVRMGIDFGTSYTKVALRAADKCFLVDWEGVRKSAKPYLLPGEASIWDGSVWLGRAGGSCRTLGGLKAPFLTPGPASLCEIPPAMVFLAWVMRYGRAWFYRHQASLVANRRLLWEVNLGVPTNSWSSPKHDEAYQRLGRCAWQLSQHGGPLTLEAAERAVHQPLREFEAIQLEGLHLMPEFVAQLAGYIKSPQRQDGLHLLMDVGAGTLDAAIFNVYKKREDSENQFPIFASAVEPLGTHYFMGRRLAELGLHDRLWNDAAGPPSASRLAEELGVEVGSIQKIDDAFCARVGRTLSRLLVYTKNQRYPDAPEWRNGIRTFLAGGGASCPLYRNVLQRAFESMRVTPLLSPFPGLDEAETPSSGIDEFHRLSVAVGLTQDAESVGCILAPREVEDAEPTVEVWQRPDRDDLYPK